MFYKYIEECMSERRKDESTEKSETILPREDTISQGPPPEHHTDTCGEKVC